MRRGRDGSVSASFRSRKILDENHARSLAGGVVFHAVDACEEIGAGGFGRAGGAEKGIEADGRAGDPRMGDGDFQTIRELLDGQLQRAVRSSGAAERVAVNLFACGDKGIAVGVGEFGLAGKMLERGGKCRKEAGAAGKFEQSPFAVSAHLRFASALATSQASRQDSQ